MIQPAAIHDDRGVLLLGEQVDRFQRLGAMIVELAGNLLAGLKSSHS